jgi:hypothetical protein
MCVRITWCVSLIHFRAAGPIYFPGVQTARHWEINLMKLQTFMGQELSTQK